MALRTAAKTISDQLLLGRCLPYLRSNATKVQVLLLELDEHVLKYYGNYHIFYALDRNKICKTGDMVLIKKLPQNLSKLITHEVIEVAYPLGDVTDPVTGEKCIGPLSRTEIEKNTKLIGERKEAFKYAKAPKRGWQEGKRDFTDKDVYIRYHQFEEDEEEYNDPYSIGKGW